MSQICRTCLEEISDSDFLIVNDVSNKIKDELVACVPELDLSLTPDATICVYCANSLHAAYDFKQKCLQSEEKIRSHKKSSKGLDLVQIKQEPEFDEKFDVVHGVGIGMEVIYIKDDAESKDERNVGCVRDEPVTSFLNCKDEWSPKMISGGAAQNNSVKSNGKAHSINKKKLKNVKKEPKSSFHESNCTNTRSKRLVHSLNGEKAFKCDLCTYTTPREALLKLHVKTHSSGKPYRCSKCTYEASSRIGLQNHLRKCNSSDTKRTLKHRKPFKCTQCPFQSLLKDALQEHVQVHSMKIFKCTKCPYEVSTLSTFKRHVNTHLAGKLHECQQCDYRCYNLLVLKKHMSGHKQDKSYKCHLCSFSTVHGNALATHLLIHTGERRFACTLCGYKAIQKVNLKQHMKHHTRKGPFKCTKCSYSAFVNSSLQNHMRKCHDQRKK